MGLVAQAVIKSGARNGAGEIVISKAYYIKMNHPIRPSYAHHGSVGRRKNFLKMKSFEILILIIHLMAKSLSSGRRS